MKMIFKHIFYGILLSSTLSLFSMEYKKLQDMTLDEKIGQMFVVVGVADEETASWLIENRNYRLDKEYIEELIVEYRAGGVIFSGISDAEKQKIRAAHFQSLSTIPLFIGQDLEPGRVGKHHLPDFKFPSNKKLGLLDDDSVYQIARSIGQRCKEVGVNINFAPVADVNTNPDNPVIGNRSFGDDPENVAKKAIIFARGLRDSGIIACGKHFPGHGDTDKDSHRELPKISHSKARLHEIELYPFKELIKAGIPTIMTGHLEVPALEETEKLPATLSYNIITTLLKEELGFDGLVITDALDMKGITDHFSPGQAALKAFLAGAHILLYSPDVPAAFNAIKDAVENKVITEEQINERVAKILAIKQEYLY